MKNLLNLGKVLNAKEQQMIKGGNGQADCENHGGTWKCMPLPMPPLLSDCDCVCPSK